MFNSGNVSQDLKDLESLFGKAFSGNRPNAGVAGVGSPAPIGPQVFLNDERVESIEFFQKGPFAGNAYVDFVRIKLVAKPQQQPVAVEYTSVTMEDEYIITLNNQDQLTVRSNGNYLSWLEF